jgi:hypothetical protein
VVSILELLRRTPYNTKGTLAVNFHCRVPSDNLIYYTTLRKRVRVKVNLGREQKAAARRLPHTPCRAVPRPVRYCKMLRTRSPALGLMDSMTKSLPAAR